MRPLADPVYESCDWRLLERDCERCSGRAGLRGMSTSVIEDDTPDARFITDESSTTLPFRLRVSCGGISELDLETEIDDVDECVDRLPDCVLKDLRIDFRAPFSPCKGAAGADDGSGGVVAGNGGVVAGMGGTAGEGCRVGIGCIG